MEDNINTGSFNQAGFSQLRIHELFQRIDRLFLNLFDYSPDLKVLNYNLVFSDLKTVYAIPKPKFKPEEVKEIDRIIKVSRFVLRSKPPFEEITENTFSRQIKDNQPNFHNQDAIEDVLRILRDNIENCMNKHNLMNPSKLNPNKAAIN